MKLDTIRKLILPSGPVLILTLIGVMLLSAVLYNRAVRAQRFLEPTLALFQPRFTFYSNIEGLLVDTFGEHVEGVRFVGNSILLRKSDIFREVHNPEQSPELRKLASVFERILRDASLRAYIDFIVVSPRVALEDDPRQDRLNRLRVQSTAEVILNALFDARPALERDYAIYFEASATSVYATGDEEEWVEFHIVPSERLHVDVLRRLEKYIPAPSPRMRH